MIEKATVTEKDGDAFRTIREVAEELGVPQHVLRFWESRFLQIKPLKRAGGRRYYRPEDVELLRVIGHLLYGEGYTIKGVQRMLKEQGYRAILSLYYGGALDSAPGTQIDSEKSSSPPTENFERDASVSFGTESSPSDASPPIPSAPFVAATLLSAPPETKKISPKISPADGQKLQGALRELMECARILRSAYGE